MCTVGRKIICAQRNKELFYTNSNAVISLTLVAMPPSCTEDNYWTIIRVCHVEKFHFHHGMARPWVTDGCIVLQLVLWRVLTSIAACWDETAWSVVDIYRIIDKHSACISPYPEDRRSTLLRNVNIFPTMPLIIVVTTMRTLYPTVDKR
jgi:hypothetical protein